MQTPSVRDFMHDLTGHDSSGALRELHSLGLEMRALREEWDAVPDLERRTQLLHQIQGLIVRMNRLADTVRRRTELGHPGPP
jgi:hypothetical protein